MSAYLTDLPGVFRASALHIQAHGLHKGDYAPLAFTPASPACMPGAIRLVCTGSPFESNKVAESAICFASRNMAGVAPETDGQPDYIEHLAEWNDAPERTAADVVARLLRLARDAEQAAREAALLCRYIKEHDDHLPCDWCPKDLAQYQQELRELRLEVAA